MSSWTSGQQQVLILLAEGSTVPAAAETTGVHCNTIAGSRRSSSSFRDAWAHVQYEQNWRDKMQSLVLAVAALPNPLTDEKDSPSIRLRACSTGIRPISRRSGPRAAESRRKS